MIKNIGKKGKVEIHWAVSPYDYSDDKCKDLSLKFAKKYGIPKEHIRIIPDFKLLNDKGEDLSMTNDIITNIQDLNFQLKLFKDYLNINNITDYDFNIIKDIDSEINNRIDYDKYDKLKRYTIDWIKWDNFLSYGEGNFFEFKNLNGLVLLNGEPANQSGKTTFAIDLIHFLLYGRTDKSSIQEKIFNKHIPEATKVTVEGQLTIDGERYIIKRELSRPALSKRTPRSKTVQKVSYYKLIGDKADELVDYIDNQEEENSLKTNKAIKEAIGNESDFDMIICATSSNLDDLIEKKDTERGKLLSRWIGLLPIEQKDVLAREKFNTEVKPYLYSNKYNSETLKQEIEALKLNIKALSQSREKYLKENNDIDSKILKSEDSKRRLSESKSNIDSSILKIDITTLNESIRRVTSDGKKMSSELSSINDSINRIGKVDFSINEYDELIETKNKLDVDINLYHQKYNMLKSNLDSLIKSEYCPTCGRKYDNIDNTSKINEVNKEINDLIKLGKDAKDKKDIIVAKIDKKKIDRDNYTLLSKLEIKKSACELKIEQLRGDYKDKKNLLNEYNKNNEAIDKNNKLDIEIRNIEIFIKGLRNTKETNIKNISNCDNDINNDMSLVKDRETMISKLREEELLIKNWKIYLELVGKNGISKMVLRKALPIINAQMSFILNDVCDFNVEIAINDKNDVMFYLIKDGVKSDLTSGSGFERTASALALRTVLGNMSTISRVRFIILDEIWGRVAKDNYDNFKKLLDKMLTNYDYILIISHLDEIKDYCNTIITVTKENNVSKIEIRKSK